MRLPRDSVRWNLQKQYTCTAYLTVPFLLWLLCVGGPGGFGVRQAWDPMNLYLLSTSHVPSGLKVGNKIAGNKIALSLFIDPPQRRAVRKRHGML